MSTRIEFKTTDGVTLRGDFYKAEGEARPIVVMTAGLHLLKEHYLPTFARRFKEAGISSLAFDYRNYGSSDGQPRFETNLVQQGEDYSDAVTAAMDLPGVDPTKVIIMGLGHGGAATLLAAAGDSRPKAVILQSPIVSGRRDATLFPSGWVDRAWRDRENKTRTGDQTPTYVPVWPSSSAVGPSDEPVLFQNEMAYGFITEAKVASDAARTPFENKMTLRSVLSLTSTEGRDSLYKIKQPTLYVVFPGDPFTGTAEFHRTAFDKMGPNAEFKIVTPPTDSNVDGFVTSTAVAQIEFINRTV